MHIIKVFSYVCLACKHGYYGQNCRIKCHFPYYGSLCASTC